MKFFAYESSAFEQEATKGENEGFKRRTTRAIKNMNTPIRQPEY